MPLNTISDDKNSANLADTTSIKSTYKCRPGTSILYQGSRTSWKSRIRFDLLIVQHIIGINKILEIISFNPTISIEAERIYISFEIAKTKVKNELLQTKIASEKELLIRQKKSLKDFNDTVIISQFQEQFILDYLLSRLDIKRKLWNKMLNIF